MKKILISFLVAALAYLLLWPTPIKPVAWTPPPSVPLTGIYAPNSALQSTQRIGDGVGIGAESTAIDAQGRVYTGYADGRIVRFSANGTSHEVLTQTGGRPLGLSLHKTLGLVIADASKGLLALAENQKEPVVLSNQANNTPIRLADDVSVDSTGNIYFSDASNLPLAQARLDALQHGNNGRLLKYDPKTQQTTVLMDGLSFANGVAVGSNDAFVLVNETSQYRVSRYWLKGEKAGTHDIFADNLPGMPDNITFDATNQMFWLALYSPRMPILDKLLPMPAWIKKVVARIPEFLQPQPPHKAWVLGLSSNGEVLKSLNYEAKDAFAPITSARAFGAWLYLGSLSEKSLARIPLHNFLETAPLPPKDWDKTHVKSVLVP